MPTGPNILLIVLDTARADHLPPHPLGERLAPRLSAEAAKGVALQRVHATAPWTLPSHATMFTGAYPTEHGIHGRAAVRRDARVATLRAAVQAQGERWLPEALRLHGYRTWGVSANPWVSEPMGLSLGFDRFEAVGPAKFRPRGDVGTRKRGSDRVPAAIRRPAGRIARHIKEWRGAGDSGGARAVEHVRRFAIGDAPFFGFVNMMEAHVPYAPPRAFNELKGVAGLRAPAASRRRRSYERTLAYNLRQAELPAAELATIRALYRGEIRYLDHLAGRILDSLPAGTVVVITADHGEALGEDHTLDHQTTMIEQVLRVPLIVLGPAPPPDGFASLRELAEFLAETAGLDPSAWRERSRGVPAGVAVAEYESTVVHDRRSIGVARQRGYPPAVVSILEAEMAAVIEGDRKLLAVAGRDDGLLAIDGFDARPVNDPAALRRLRSHLDAARAAPAREPPEEGYDAQEQAEIEERLSQLGYL